MMGRTRQLVFAAVTPLAFGVCENAEAITNCYYRTTYLVRKLYFMS